MIALHTAIAYVLLIRAIYLHQEGYSWYDLSGQKSLAVVAIVTNILAIITIILVRT